MGRAMLRAAPGLVVGTVMSLALCGCNDPKAREIQTRREGQIRDLLHACADREKESIGNLTHIGELIGDEKVKREGLWKADWRALAERSHEERRRWKENQPVYRAAILKQLQGNEERIREVFPLMFY